MTDRTQGDPRQGMRTGRLVARRWAGGVLLPGRISVFLELPEMLTALTV